jgi:hypothetical protein
MAKSILDAKCFKDEAAAYTPGLKPAYGRKAPSAHIAGAWIAYPRWAVRAPG